MADIEALFREHYGLIFRFLLSMCRDAHLAAIVTAVTFAAAVVWVCLHYAFFEGGMSQGMGVLARHLKILFGYDWYAYATYLYCALSPLYAHLYARWLGKE